MSSKVKDLFNMMEYNNETLMDTIPLSLSKLLQSNENRKFRSHEEICSAIPTKMVNIDRALFINNLVDTFLEEIDILVYLETNFRYFNKKDAEKSVFQFIENLRYYSGHVYNKDAAKPFSVFLTIQDYSPLPYIGSILGCTLAAGNKIIFNPTGKQMLAITYFIEDVMKRQRFPVNNFDIYYGQDGLKTFDGSEGMIFYYCGCHEEFSLAISPSKQLTFKYFDGKIPMLVFNSADLESASYSAIQAVWGFQGMMPWNVNTILVQEDVFENFVTLLKEKLLKVKIPEDISKPKLCKSYDEQFSNLVSEATKRHFDFWLPHKDELFSTLIIIGDRLIENNVILKPAYSIPFGTIVAFRNTAEAVALANNSRQGLAASVWTENIGLANEVSRKLQVGTVWINSHGQFRPEVSFCHQKSGYGLGYLNGIDGAFQNEYIVDTIENENIDSAQKKPKKSLIDFTAIFSKLKKAQSIWSNLSAHHRTLKLREFGLFVKNNITHLTIKLGLKTQELDEWIRLLTEVKPINNNTICEAKCDIKSYRESIGPMVLVATDGDFKKFVISAIGDGNVLLLLNKDTSAFSKFIQEMENKFSGIVKCIYGSVDDISEDIMRNNLDSLFVQSNVVISFQKWKSQTNVISLNHLDDYRFLTSKVKNIWGNCGDSFM